MTQLTGKHLVNGNWVGGSDSFQSDNPHKNIKNPTEFSHGSVDLISEACLAAEECAERFASLPISKRSDFLRCVAEEIEKLGDAITETGQSETNLPTPRLQGERARTVGQIRFFADWIEEGNWLAARIDTALPDRAPLPRPDLRVANKAIGPVGVFGASNFPLAFSTAGGDTASALAAGCPVVVKSHPAHPGTSELMAQAFHAAIQKCDMPSGIFHMIQGGDFSVGQSLVAHPSIKAVGFTGSLAGGRALYDIATSRPEPIPFYGELGSNNPVFLLPETLTDNAEKIAEACTGSLTMGVGQICTNPGVIIALKGPALERFKTKAVSLLQEVAPQAMLTERIATAYHQMTTTYNDDDRLTCLLTPQGTDNPYCATPGVYSTDFKTWRDHKELSEEIFGPSAIIVECDDTSQMITIAKNFAGQLTSTIHMIEGDTILANQLMPYFEKSSGRILVNGFPTGVEVCHAMVHGGPYPASTYSRSTSVGSLAIERFIRPVCYQNMPDALLPEPLKSANPLGIQRLVNGAWSRDAL